MSDYKKAVKETVDYARNRVLEFFLEEDGIGRKLELKKHIDASIKAGKEKLEIGNSGEFSVEIEIDVFAGKDGGAYKYRKFAASIKTNDESIFRALSDFDLNSTSPRCSIDTHFNIWNPKLVGEWKTKHVYANGGKSHGMISSTL